MTHFDYSPQGRYGDLALEPEPGIARFFEQLALVELDEQPLVPEWASIKSKFMSLDPVCDVRADHLRLPVRNHESDAFPRSAGLLSACGHAGLAVLLVAGGHLGWLFQKSETSEVVEVTFGLEIPLQHQGRIQRSRDAAQPVPDQATKAPEQLPQLPKRFEVDSVPPPSDDAEMPAPTEKSAERPPTDKKSPKPEATRQPNKVVAPERDKDAQKVKFDEVARRLEREQRKVGEMEKKGQREKPVDPVVPGGMDIPENPLADPSNAPLPDMPDALVPTGSLSGRRLAGSAAEAYKTAAFVHMKRFWTLPDIVDFAPDLSTRAVIVVNVFGRILSVEIDQSSGNPAFDALVTEQILKAEPFPDLPAGSGQNEKIYLLFQPRSVME